MKGRISGGISGSGAERLFKHGGATLRRTHFQMQLRAVKMKAEPEERAASLLVGGQRRDLGCAVGGQGEPDSVLDLLPPGTLDELPPLGDALAESIAVQRAGDRGVSPAFGFGGMPVGQESDVDGTGTAACRSTPTAACSRTGTAVWPAAWRTWWRS